MSNEDINGTNVRKINTDRVMDQIKDIAPGEHRVVTLLQGEVTEAEREYRKPLQLNGTDCRFWLESVDLYEMEIEARNTIIDEVVKKFDDEIVVIEATGAASRD